MKHMELIIDFTTVGDDYQIDNHGRLIRCKDCFFYNDPCCELFGWLGCEIKTMPEGYCYMAEQRKAGKKLLHCRKARRMSEKNGKVCCNCRHCIRSHDDKYDMTVCRCDIDNERLSYMQVMAGWCKHWSKERREE